VSGLSAAGGGRCARARPFAEAVASAEPEVIVHEPTALGAKMSIRDARQPERFEGAIIAAGTAAGINGKPGPVSPPRSDPSVRFLQARLEKRAGRPGEDF
jgi:hypothetical protein